MNFGLPPGKEPDEVAVSDRLSNKGMPIGNLTSQMFANIYLNEVDQYAKHELGLHYYIRYMDDIIILHHDKKYLAEVKELLRAFLSDELRLDLNNKTTIRPCSMGVDFVGFRIWSTHRRLKKKTAVKIKRNLKNQIAKVKAGEERKKTPVVNVNWPQAVLSLHYIEEQAQECITMEDANEGEKE